MTHQASDTAPIDNLTSAPLVAVLFCVHYHAKPAFFEEALASLYAQTHKNLRVFLYCDGPILPAHEEVIQRLMRLSSGQDRVLRGEKNLGLAAGLNRLIDLALEDPEVAFMARMDADDISVPHRIECQLAYLRDHPEVSLAGSWCIEFSQRDVPIFYKRMPERQEDIRKAMQLRNALAHPTVVFRRETLERGYRYDPETFLTEDYELWSRMIVNGEVISNVPEYLFWFRIDDDFFNRRRGIKLAWSELVLRVNYARRTSQIRPLVLFGILALLCIRLAPSPIGYLAYKSRR